MILLTNHSKDTKSLCRIADSSDCYLINNLPWTRFHFPNHTNLRLKLYCYHKLSFNTKLKTSFSHEEIIPVNHLLKNPSTASQRSQDTKQAFPERQKKWKGKISTESHHKTSTRKHNKKKDSYAITQPKQDLTIAPILN